MRILLALLVVLMAVGEELASRQRATRSRAAPGAWDPSFGWPGTSGTVHASALFDDGTGTALYVGGVFSAAGNAHSETIARWTGTRWEPVPTPWVAGSYGSVSALAAHDDGSGPRLWAGGFFYVDSTTHALASWDGSAWTLVPGTSLGPYLVVSALLSDGELLYAGGRFSRVDGVAARNVAAYDGVSWSPMGSAGIAWNVEALELSDAQGPTRLYAASRNGGYPAVPTLQYWGGSDWVPLGGVDGNLFALESYDPGGGTRLAIGGYEATWQLGPGGVVPLDETAPPYVNALASREEEGRDVLYVGGSFTNAGGQLVNRVARFDGEDWRPLVGAAAGTSGPVTELRWFDLGAGDALLVGGGFEQAGGRGAGYVALWSAGDWRVMGSGQGLVGRALGLAEFDDGGGLRLYAAGEFRTAGNAVTEGLARWEDGAWAPIAGSPFDDDMGSMTVWDDGTGPALYVSGEIGFYDNAVARWDGATWSLVGSDFAGSIYDLEVADLGDGPTLYAAGSFVVPQSGAQNVAMWDGASWVSIGALSVGTFPGARSLAVFDDGGGPKLYAGGVFLDAAGTPVSNVAAWDGSAWSDVGGGVTGTVCCSSVAQVEQLLAVDLPLVGRRLVACGNFTSAGGVPGTATIAAWNGTAWEPLGGPVSAIDVYALAQWGRRDRPRALCRRSAARLEPAGRAPAGRLGSDRQRSRRDLRQPVDPPAVETRPTTPAPLGRRRSDRDRSRASRERRHELVPRVAADRARRSRRGRGLRALIALQVAHPGAA